MALYRIIRIYDVPADNRIQATNRMMEALEFDVERYFHVMDYVKEPEDPKGKGRPIDLTPPKGWLTLLMEELVAQITGRGINEAPRIPGSGPWLKPKLYKGKSEHAPEAEAEKKKR